MLLGKHPVADGRVDGKPEVSDERDGAGGGVERADRRAGKIAPGATIRGVSANESPLPEPIPLKIEFPTNRVSDQSAVMEAEVS
jgi:hypothetical protein